MRVTLFSEQLLQPIPGGIGTYVRALLRHLPAEGIEVEPVVAAHTRETLYRAGLSGARRMKFSRAMLYGAWAKGHGPTLKGDGEVVHAPSLAMPRPDRRPFVVTVHDVLFKTFPEFFPPRGLDFHDRMLARVDQADVVIVPSRATAKGLADVGLAAQRVEVIPQGTDVVRLDDAQRDLILDSMDVVRPYVLWVGTVEPRKNPAGVVRGFANALTYPIRNRESLRLYMAGPDGWWEGDLSPYIEARGLTDRVARVNAPSALQRAALYSGAEAFLFPSFAEGFGLPVLEAMACGCPVVTSNRSSLPEVAGSAAQLCDPTDDDAIGEALAAVLKDKELAADLTRLGYERAKQLNWRATAKLTAAVYRSL